MNPPPFRWQPGQRVICLDDKLPNEAIPCFSSLPVSGRGYTLASVKLGHHWKTKAPAWNVQLRECPPVANPHFPCAGFDLQRFRPVADHFAVTTHHRRKQSFQKAPRTRKWTLV